MKTAFLGPIGTFSSEAANILSPNSEKIPYDSFRDILSACESGETNEAVIPIENSIEGVVNASIDELVFEKNLYIQQSVMLPIEQNLIAIKGTELKDIKRVISHSHALPQCKNFLSKMLPNAALHTVSSTGEGVRLASQEGFGTAAIGNKEAAKIYGLEVIAPAIQDNKQNFTQFVKVSKTPTVSYEGCTHATIAFSTPHRPGALFDVLEIFAVYNINLSEIFSRPMKNKPHEYVFVVDIMIQDNKDDISAAVELMKRKSSFIKTLGIYSVIKI